MTPSPHGIEPGRISTTAFSGRRSRSNSPLLNRELSWLDFNARVLALAADTSQPLLERVKFGAIFASNLDEYFQVRVAGLKDEVEDGITERSPDGLRPAETLQRVCEEVRALTSRHAALIDDVLLPELRANDIDVTSWDSLTPAERGALAEVFNEGVFPVLTPLAVDPGHPFPYISNLSLNLGALVHNPETGETRFARVKVPSLLPRFVELEEGRRYIPIEELIAAHLQLLFPGMEVVSAHAFRVTRDADLDLEESEAEDLLTAVESTLARRRFGKAVRLEISDEADTSMVDKLRSELELEADDIYHLRGLLDVKAMFSLVAINRPDLKQAPWKPQTPLRLQSTEEHPRDLFAEIAARDVLVHHPYDSFVTSVERFVAEAAADPAVLTIKLTLYRTSGDSPIVKSLIDAAQRDKQVVALVELKARFDEQANINWARKLEQAGVHVVYGLIGLKTHTKVALVVRAELEGLKRYVHLSTGNYNSTTARIYEDVSVFTADPDFGADMSMLFNSLTGFSNFTNFRKVFIAPTSLREHVIGLIRREHPTATRGPGRIVMKMNSLVDPAVIEALYDASGQGVQIDLLIRGICCLRPGVPGMSDNIRVRSLVGRFLEHSRIWFFENGEGDGENAWYLGSADMMPRNLDRRVEVVAPVTDPEARAQLASILEVLLADNQLAWLLDGEGAWTVVPMEPGEAPINAHEVFEAAALERAGVVRASPD